jgi:hypothetical protein
MADTNHHSADIPIEQDGISYSGLVWFTLVLTGSVLLIHVLMWGMFTFMESRAAVSDVARAPLAGPAGARPAGTAVQSQKRPPAPAHVYVPDEPTNLRNFQRQEDLELTTYGWADQNAGTLRIPIDRAKALLLERGLPVRGQAQPPPVKK